MKKRFSLLLALMMIFVMPLANMESEEIILAVPEEAVETVETVEEEIEVVAAPEEDIDVVPAPEDEAEEPAEESPFVVEDGVLTAYLGEDEDVVLPEGITVIAAGAFKDNEVVKTVYAPDSLLAIEDYAFEGCTALVEVSYPETAEIGENAFTGSAIAAEPAEEAADEEEAEVEIELEEPAVEAVSDEEIETVPAEDIAEDDAFDVVSKAASIKTQPVDVTTTVGTATTISIVATGSNLTYQWQYLKTGATTWTNATSEGAKAASWTFTATAGLNGRQYRCVVTDGDGNVTKSKRMTLTVNAGPAITTQPTDVDAVDGANATLSLVASGSGLTYQWEYQKPGDTTWTAAKSSGAKTASWTFAAAASYTGRMYRCVVTDASGNTATSNAVTLTVTTIVATSIKAQPKDVTVNVGESATISITATGTGLSYQWQYLKSGATSWTNAVSEDAKAASWTFTATAGLNGRQYRCVITNAAGTVTKSNRMTLTVTSGPSITTQPTDITVADGANATLSVVASGSNLSYQWQYQKSGATTWTDAKSSGAKAASWTFAAASSYSGRKYRCIVTDASGNTATSNAVTLTVTTIVATSIKVQPKDVTVSVGESATISITATGTGLSYQWQYLKSGATTWTDAKSADAKAASWTFTATAGLNGRQYRCVITNAAGTVTKSNRMTLTVTSGPSIITQPTDITVNVNEKGTLSVVASGSSLSYQWQYLKTGSTTWTDATSVDAKAASWTFTATAGLNGRQYRCVITDGAGNSTISDAVTLTVETRYIVNDVIYELINNVMTVTGYQGTATSYTVAKTVGGKTVTAIGESAFEGNTRLKSITLPDTITVIGKRAFANCTNLSSMN